MAITNEIRLPIYFFQKLFLIFCFISSQLVKPFPDLCFVQCKNIMYNSKIRFVFFLLNCRFFEEH